MNFPTLPDSIPKLFVILGLALGIYSFITYSNAFNNYINKLIEQQEDLQRLGFEQDEYIEFQKETIKELKETKTKVSALSKIIELKSLYSLADLEKASKQLDQEVAKAVKLHLKSDSLHKLILKKEFEVKLKNLRVEQAESQYKRDQFDTNLFFLISAVLFFGGLLVWLYQDYTNEELLKRDLIDKPTFSPNCQSCGKKFNSFISYGYDSISSPNYHYCRVCYSNGSFTEPFLTVDEVKDRATAELKFLNVSDKEISKVVAKIEKLHRWKKNNYV